MVSRPNTSFENPWSAFGRSGAGRADFSRFCHVFQIDRDVPIIEAYTSVFLIFHPFGAISFYPSPLLSGAISVHWASLNFHCVDLCEEHFYPNRVFPIKNPGFPRVLPADVGRPEVFT